MKEIGFEVNETAVARPVIEAMTSVLANPIVDLLPLAVANGVVAEGVTVEAVLQRIRSGDYPYLDATLGTAGKSADVASSCFWGVVSGWYSVIEQQRAGENVDALVVLYFQHFVRVQGYLLGLSHGGTARARPGAAARKSKRDIHLEEIKAHARSRAGRMSRAKAAEEITKLVALEAPTILRHLLRMFPGDAWTKVD